LPELLEPKEFAVTTLNGEEKTFVLSKFPSVIGREICAGYPLTSVPKLSEYKSNEEIMLKLMRFVGIKLPTMVLPLTTRELVDNHTSDWETLAKLEWEMLRYNTSFLSQEKVSTFLKDTIMKRLASTMPILKDFLQQSLERSKQPGKN
jgi:hypothetical protein